MRKCNLNGCSFKPIELKKPKPIVRKPVRRAKTYCICSEIEPNIFKAFVNIPSNLECPDTLCLDFTERSYSLKGRTQVFTSYKDKKGKSICIIRNEIEATHFPGLSVQYTSFKDNYVYSGYVVNINGVLQFDIIEVLGRVAEYKELVYNIKIKNKQ